MKNQWLLSRIKRKNKISAVVQTEKSEKRKLQNANISLGIAAVGVVGAALLYYYQIRTQNIQNHFQRDFQNRQFKLDSTIENKKFEYTIIEKSSELPSINAVATNLDNYIELKLLSGETRHYEKLLAENQSRTIPFTGRRFRFNTDLKDLPLLLVANGTANPCKAGPGIGCWSRVVHAKPGDLVSLQLYFHNTSDTAATRVEGGMSPEWTRGEKVHVFYGGIIADNETDRDSVVVVSKTMTIMTFIPGSVRFYPKQSHTGHIIMGEEYLFGQNGINLGDIGPGWRNQGVLIADFRVAEAL